MSTEVIIIASVLMTISLLVAIAPLIYGEVKKRRVVKPVEFLPPKGASPADVLIGYYGAFAHTREVFNPLMLYWAERGFITIEEDCKRGLKLTKIKGIECPEGDCFNRKTFEAECELFNSLFPGRNKTFYTLTAGQSFKKDFDKLTSSCNEQAKKISAEKSKKFSIISFAFAIIMLISVDFLIGLSIEESFMALLIVFPLMAMLMSKIALSTSSDSGGIHVGSSAWFISVPFFSMFGIIPFVTMTAFLPTEASLLILSAMIVCIAVIYFISPKIDIRSDEQLKTYARICGFKKFLLRAEKRQLEMLVEDDPQYFYNILPYCYALKITKKLKHKFDRIDLEGPAWYLGEIRDILMF